MTTWLMSLSALQLAIAAQTVVFLVVVYVVVDVVTYGGER